MIKKCSSIDDFINNFTSKKKYLLIITVSDEDGFFYESMNRIEDDDELNYIIKIWEIIKKHNRVWNGCESGKPEEEYKNELTPKEIQIFGDCYCPFISNIWKIDYLNLFEYTNEIVL